VILGGCCGVAMARHWWSFREVVRNIFQQLMRKYEATKATECQGDRMEI